MTETEIVTSICEYLELMRHCYTRVNNIGVYDPKRGHFRKRSRHNKKGMPDILCVHVGVPYFLEAKREGEEQTPEQKKFQEEVERAGGVYAVVRSIDDVRRLGL